MPIICFREKIKIKHYEAIVSFAFNCIYDDNYHLKLRDYVPNYFDSGDFRNLIEKTFDNFTASSLMSTSADNGSTYIVA